MKIVPELRDLPYEEQFQQLKLPIIPSRHLHGDMVNVYKCASEIYSHHLLNFQQTCQTRSNGFKLNGIRRETAKFQNFLTNSIVDSWNSLRVKW